MLPNNLLPKLSSKLKTVCIGWSEGDRPALNTSNKPKHKTAFIADIVGKSYVDQERSLQAEQTTDLTESLGKSVKFKDGWIFMVIICLIMVT